MYFFIVLIAMVIRHPSNKIMKKFHVFVTIFKLFKTAGAHLAFVAITFLMWEKPYISIFVEIGAL
jgi:hypothetical protein